MSRILFIQKEASEKFGVMSLSGVLKKNGHEVEIFIELLEKGSIFEFCEKFRPDFIAFSVTTMERDWALDLALKIKKKFKVFSVFGGAEPTYDPSIISHPAVDFICRGEGEEALLELLEKVKKRDSVLGVKNIWGKKGKKIIKNSLRNLIFDLNSLPAPDRQIYYKYALLRNLSTKKILCSRGCPYNCTYCSNHAYLKLFRGLGKYVRFRDPKEVIEEILEIRGRYGFKRIYFADETFTLNREWLYKFLSLYNKKVNAPFSCLVRANELDQKTVKTLKKSGCFYVAFGLESGSDRIRNGILKRNMKDGVLLNASKFLKKYKIPFLTHQMYVLPTETLSEAFKTVELNIKMGTDSVWDTVFQPFKNTELYEFCKTKKLFSKNFKVDSMFGKSWIVNSEKKQIQNLRSLAWLTIRLPWMMPLTKKLVFLPDNLLFELILKISEAYSIKRRWRLSNFEMAKLAFRTGKKLG